MREILDIVMVQTGNYCGRGLAYVTTLIEQIRQHVTVPYRLNVITDDDPQNYPNCRVIPARYPGWWEKLRMFERGLFNGRVMFVDLDTMIVSNIDDICAHRTGFATLRDFYREDALGPAVILFDAPQMAWIYDEWAAMGCPTDHPNGDQWFLNNLTQGRFRGEIQKLQDLFPGRFVSYKQSCFGRELPQDASFICFHGRPRPHEIEDGWATEVWKSGGLVPVQFVRGLNVPAARMIEQARQNLARDLPLFREVEPHAGVALIVGGGPSLADTYSELQFHRRRGGMVFALNGTHDWLVERGTVPDFHVILDARPENARFVQRPQKRCTYLIAAQCHPDVFDALAGQTVITWLGWVDGAHALADEFPNKPLMVVGGGSTVGLRTMNLVHLWGFRRQRLFGFDSAYRQGANHAYPQAMNDGERTVEITANGRKFLCAGWMARQALGFQWQARQLEARGTDIHVHGDGLIPWIVQQQGETEHAAA